MIIIKNARKDKEKNKGNIVEDSQRKKKRQPRKKVEDRHRKRQKVKEKVEGMERNAEEKDRHKERRIQEKKEAEKIGYEKTKVKKMYVSFREYIAIKDGRKKMTELRFSKQKIWKERQRRKIDIGKAENKNRKRQKRKGYEKNKVKKIYFSFREQITIKGGRKKTTELWFERFICAGEISSRDLNEGSHGSQNKKHSQEKSKHTMTDCLFLWLVNGFSRKKEQRSYTKNYNIMDFWKKAFEE